MFPFLISNPQFQYIQLNIKINIWDLRLFSLFICLSTILYPTVVLVVLVHFILFTLIKFDRYLQKNEFLIIYLWILINFLRNHEKREKISNNVR